MSKFLNTATHFSFESLWSLMISALAPVINSFSCIEGEGDAFGAITDARVPVNGLITITRIRAIAGGNTLSVPCTVAFHDDGVDVASVVIPAGDVTLQDSGALSVNIAAGSLCAIHYSSGAGAGVIDQVGVEVQIQRALN